VDIKWTRLALQRRCWEVTTEGARATVTPRGSGELSFDLRTHPIGYRVRVYRKGRLRYSFVAASLVVAKHKIERSFRWIRAGAWPSRPAISRRIGPLRTNGLLVRRMTDAELLSFLNRHPLVIERSHLPPWWASNPRVYFAQILAGMALVGADYPKCQDLQRRADR